MEGTTHPHEVQETQMGQPASLPQSNQDPKLTNTPFSVRSLERDSMRSREGEQQSEADHGPSSQEDRHLQSQRQVKALGAVGDRIS